MYTWRRDIKRKFYSRALWAPHAILDDATCELLSSIGPITTIEKLALLLKANWERWDELGSNLFNMISNLETPPLLPAPRRTQKRAAPAQNIAQPLNSSEIPLHPPTKRARTSITSTQPIQAPNLPGTPLLPTLIPASEPAPAQASSSAQPSSSSHTNSTATQSMFPVSQYDQFFASFGHSK